MAAGKFISYLRVSTAKQGVSGLGLEAQRNAVAEFLNGGRWKLLEEVVEIESGKRSDRPQLAKALALCRLHKATLVVARLDGLARNVHFLSGLIQSGVDFVACDLPQANKLTLHVLASVAEAEAEAISTRTKVALAAAKKRGVVLGGDRGKLTPAIRRRGVRRSIEVRQSDARKRAADLLPVIEHIRENGANSLRQIADGLNELKIPTARGGEWSAVQVQRVLATTVD